MMPLNDLNSDNTRLLNSIGNKVRRFLFAGVHSDIMNGNARRILITNLFCLVGIFFMGVLGLVALIHEKALLASILLSITFLYCIAILYIRWTANYRLGGRLIIYPLYILMLYLAFTGGVGGAGHVWVFCVPAVALFLQGLKRGLKELSVFTFLLTIILFFADETQGGHNYDNVFASRVLYAFLVVVFLSTIYEYSMSHYNQMLRETSDRLAKKAITDELTRLLNRYGMYGKLETPVSGKRHILLMDIDHFKQINDTYGHDAGDLYLSKVAEVLTSTIGAEGVVARWGGEEFLILLSASGLEESKHWARRVCADVSNLTVSFKGESLRATISIGVSCLEEHSKVHDAISRADAALYEAKREGRNRFVVAQGLEEASKRKV